jgi:peroxiredoxin
MNGTSSLSLKRLPIITVFTLLTIVMATSTLYAVDEVAPDFSLVTLDGETVKLSDYKDKVVILNFWATWCPPCRKEIPHFIEMYEEQSSEGLVILGISVDKSGVDAVKKWADKNQVNYPMVMSDDATYDAYQQLLASEDRGGIPNTFIINKEGVIKNTAVGYRNKSAWQAMIAPLLK